MSTKPHELDIDLNRMRADKINELRSIMRDLDDLDAVERVLNRQTAQIAVSASLMIQTNGGNGNGHANGHSLLEAAQQMIEEHEDKRGKQSPHRRKGAHASDVTTAMNQILEALRMHAKKGPLQTKHILAAIQNRFAPPYAAQSTFSRGLLLLQRQKKIVRHMPPGQQYPTYALPRGASPAVSKQEEKAKPKRKIRRGRAGIGRGADPSGVSAGILRVLADADPSGLTIPDITKILESDGHTQFLPDHAHNSQVSWALKGHRERHRVKTVTKFDGTRVHQLIRPKITVTKEPEAEAQSPSE